MRTKTWLSDAQNELRLRTWIACNIVAQRCVYILTSSCADSCAPSADASFGHIPIAPFEKSVLHLNRVEGVSDLPDDLQHQSRDQGFCNRVSKTMSSQASEEREDTSLSISLLESDLEALEQEIKAKLSGEDQSCLAI